MYVGTQLSNKTRSVIIRLRLVIFFRFLTFTEVVDMQSNTEDTAFAVQESTLPYSNRCLRVCGGLCIALSTLFFLGTVVAIVWIFENKQPMRYAVVCFMVGSGVIYITAFTSSLLLLTREINKRPRTISRDLSNSTTERVRNNEGYETASDISYRQGTNFLQVPQRIQIRKTPPPPYDGLSRNSTEQGRFQNNIDESTLNEQYTVTITNNVTDEHGQVLDDAGLTLNKVYYELNKDDVQREQVVPRIDIELQELQSLESVTGSTNGNLLTCAMRKQVELGSSNVIQKNVEVSSDVSQDSFGNSRYQDADDSECSSRSIPAHKNLPREKQKLKARLSMSHSDLNSGRIPQYSESNLNPEIWTSHLNLNPKMKKSHSNLNPEMRISYFNLNPEMQISHSNLNTEMRINLNPEMKVSHSNLNFGQIRSSYNENFQSNAKMQETPPLLRSSAIAETTQSKLISERQEIGYRSDADGAGNSEYSKVNLNVPGNGNSQVFQCRAEVHTSQSNLNLERRLQNCQSDYNKIGLPRTNSNSPATPRVSRSNVQISQSNLNHSTRPECNKEIEIPQSNLNQQGTPKVSRSNADVPRSPLNLVSERKPSLRPDWDTRSSPSNFRHVELFSRTNTTRTSQLNLNHERPQTSPSSLNVVMEIPEYQKPESSVIYERPQLESKLNFRVHPDQRFTSSNSNLHSNSDKKSNSNYVQKCSSHMIANTNSSVTNPNISDSKQTSKYLKHIQTIPQPKQFVACSRDAPTLQKAQSFQSLSVTSPPRNPAQTKPKSVYENSEVHANRQMSGRSTESVLDATRNYQEMTPKDWIEAWNKGFRKLPPKDAERIVGVRL